MAKTDETPKPAEKSGSAKEEKQKVDAEQPAATEQPEIPKEARMWAMFCHLAGLAGFVVPIIVAGIIAPLIVWQIKKEENPFLDEQGKEAVNFQISMLLYAVIGSAVCLVTCIGVPLIPVVCLAVGIVDLVFLLIAAVKANNGQHYRYPLTIRFIK